MLYRLTCFLIAHATALCDRWGRTRLIFDRDEPNEVYLKRYYLIGTQRTRWLPVLCLHRFLRSDQGHLHDHPWSFVSLVLRGGYYETRPSAAGGFAIRWRGRGGIAYRRATDLHRVELFPDSRHGQAPTRDMADPVWTLVLMFPRVRQWGFAEFDAQGITTWWRWDHYLNDREQQARIDRMISEIQAFKRDAAEPLKWETT